MKRSKLYGMVLAASLSTGFTLAPVFTPPSAAQGPRTNQAAIGTLLGGLINVNLQNVAVNIGDITVADLVDVQLANVLNNNQIDILRNAIQNNPIASYNQNVLNGLLQGADILTDNQIVIGVLGGAFYVLTLPLP